MQKALAIFKRDIQRLLKNPIALVITLGVCIIPSLYAWYNIVANWDPYGNTGNVRVAVTNEDQGATTELTGSLNAGAEVVDQLKENHDLGWVFVDSDQAKQGVEHGDYYAAIIIPRDFSKDLTSMLTGTFVEPKISYYVNEKQNAVAPKVTDTGAETIEEQVNATFVSTVTETVVKTARDAGIELKDSSDSAAGKLLDRLQGAQTAVKEVRGTLDSMGEAARNAQEGVAAVHASLDDLSSTVPTLSQTLSQNALLLADARTSAGTFASSLNTALANGSAQLGRASTQANAAVGKLSGTVSAAQTKVDLILGDVQILIDGNNQAIDVLEGLDKTDALQGVIDRLRAMNDQLASVHDGLSQQSSAIKQDMSALDEASQTINTSIQDGVAATNQVSTHLNSQVVPQLSSGLDMVSQASDTMAGAVASLSPAVSQASATLSQLNTVLDQVKTVASQANDTLAGLEKSLEQAQTDVAALRSSQAVKDLAGFFDIDAHEAAEFMSSPVKLTTKTVFPVKNYGSGVAPFYTNLALWVGGFVLIAIFKLEVDREGVGAISAREGYMGRWLLMVLLGFVQAVIVCAGDLALGIQCEHPALFMLAGIFASFVYVNIIYALASAFKHIGKALAVVLVIVQIPGSSGMYPIEMMPGFYQALHPLLPFTYSINAMRECVGGLYGMTYITNLAALLVFLAIALIIGLWLRPLVLNLNLLFDRQLSGTGVMICEHNDLPRERYSLRHALRGLLDTELYREQLIVRATRFERRYPILVRLGFSLTLIIPILLAVLAFALNLSIDSKITLLVVWIASIIALDVYLIVVEYIRESLNVQMRVSALSDEKLRHELARHTAASPFAAKVLGLPRSDDDAYRAERTSKNPLQVPQKGGDR